MSYPTYFGGVGAMSIFDFQLVNGFSNRFFGWGGEDDDFRRRIVKNKLKIQRLKPEVGRYKAAFHKPEKKNPKRFKILRSLENQQDEDGLTTLKYKLLKFKKLKLYTWILAEPADTGRFSPAANMSIA